MPSFRYPLGVVCAAFGAPLSVYSGVLFARMTTFEAGLFFITSLAMLCYGAVRVADHGAKTNPDACLLRRMPRFVEKTVRFFESIFTVVFLVFVLRSFLFEPFRIPSGSMLPTMHIGDFVLVNKFAYGVRVPVTGHRLFYDGVPKRGDIAIFQYPPEPSVNYVKRIIGLPGDEIQFVGRKYRVNGELVEVAAKGAYQSTQRALVAARGSMEVMEERLDDRAYEVLWMPGRFNRFANQTITVPDGHYFVMGDNRDNSSDSRFWGFLADKHLKGRAAMIWMSLGQEDANERVIKTERIGTRF